MNENKQTNIQTIKQTNKQQQQHGLLTFQNKMLLADRKWLVEFAHILGKYNQRKTLLTVGKVNIYLLIQSLPTFIVTKCLDSFLIRVRPWKCVTFT